MAFFWLTLILSGCDWAATWYGWRRLRWITKPGALLALIAWFSVSDGWQGPLVWFGAGLGFSLLGDILLLLPGQFFALGGASFLLTHVLYIAGFVAEGTPAALPPGLIFMLLMPTVTPSAAVQAIRSVSRQRRKALFRIAGGTYALLLCWMTLTAFSTFFRSTWAQPAAALVSAGAALFLISDAALAYNRFMRPKPILRLLVIVAYHIAQILITAGALANFT